MMKSDMDIVLGMYTGKFEASIKSTKKHLQSVSQEAVAMTKDLQASMDALAKSVEGLNNNFSKSMGGAKKSIKKTTDEINSQRKGFPAWALSIMFLGMMLKRVFDQIWRSSTQTFKDVMHSVEGTTTEFDRLEGSLTFLRFVAGQALEPLAKMLVPIILKVADWISENEELFRTIVAATAAFGTLFIAVGQIALGIAAIKSMANAVGLITTEANGVKSFDWAGLGNYIRGAVGLISIFWAVKQAKDAFDSLSSNELGDGLLKAVSAGLLGFGGMRVLRGAAGGGPLILLGVGFELLAQRKFVETFMRFFGLLSGLVGAAAEGIGHLFSQGFGDALRSGLRFALQNLLRQLSGVLDLMPGVRNSINNAIDAMIKPSSRDSFDFGEAFGRHYAHAVVTGREADKMIGGWIDTLNDLVPPEGFSVPDTSPAMSPAPTMSPVAPVSNYYGDTVVNIDSTAVGTPEFQEYMKTLRRMI